MWDKLFRLTSNIPHPYLLFAVFLIRRSLNLWTSHSFCWNINLQGMWGSERRCCFYQTGSPPLLSFGTSLTLAKDHNLLLYISQSIGAVLLWCFLLSRGFRFSGSCVLLSPGISLVLEQVLTRSGAMCPSLWSQPFFACEVLQCFPTGLAELLRGKVRPVRAEGKSGKEGVFHHL